MKIGMKIGLGFLAMLLLTVVLGGWAIIAMYRGSDAATEIANDRLPRFIEWGDAQANLLEAAYYSRVYFDGGDEKDINRTHELLKDFGAKLDELTKINSVIHYETTGKKLEQGKKDLAKYSGIMTKNQEVYKKLEQISAGMRSDTADSLDNLEKLIAAMGAEAEELIKSGQENQARQYLWGILRANEIYASLSDMSHHLLLAEQKGNISEYAKMVDQLPAIRRQAENLGTIYLTTDCRKLFSNAVQAFNKYAEACKVTSSVLQEFLDLNKQRFDQFQAMYKETIGMVDLTTSNSTEFAHRTVTSLNSSIVVVSIILCVMIVLGIIISVFITSLIVKPLARTQRFAQDVASGDLERQLNVRGKDETGMLADALRSMVAALRTNISDAQRKSEEAQRATEESVKAMARAEEAARAAETARRDGMLAAAEKLEGMAEIISSASTELTAQIEQSDHGAMDSSARLQEAATAMNEMNATVQEVARNAGQAAEESLETRHKAEAGQQVVMQVVQSITEVHQTSMTLKNDMAQLNENAQDINRIMGVISDIADQTNLLALNAAIEAARAGEAGRGFAVVADEVRKLAEKTMSSTMDVSNAIKAIQDSTEKSMRAVDSAVDRISEATALANQSGSALEEIVATVERTADDVRAIATASEEQSAASEEINKSITEVNDMSKHTVDAMNLATIAVSNLANEAQKMAALIEEMKRA